MLGNYRDTPSDILDRCLKYQDLYKIDFYPWTDDTPRAIWDASSSGAMLTTEQELAIKIGKLARVTKGGSLTCLVVPHLGGGHYFILFRVKND